MMKKNLAYFAVFALVIGAMFFSPLSVRAAADDVTFSDDVTLYFPSVGTGESLRVLGGSTAASYTVSDSSVTFNMEDGSNVGVRSLTSKVLSVSVGTYSCGGAFSSASQASTETETFTVTLSETKCSTGSGGGGGGAVATAAPAVDTTTPATTSVPETTSPSESAASTPVVQQATPQTTASPTIQITGGTPFARRLVSGSQGSDVQQLQEMLVNDGVYPEGLITGYFGSLTRKAVRAFQEKYGIANQGDPGYGDVGPNTRAKLNQVLLGTPPASTPAMPAIPAAEAVVRAQLEAQVQALQEQLVTLLAQLATQLQAQVQQSY